MTIQHHAVHHAVLGKLEPFGLGNIPTDDPITLEASPHTDLFTPPDGSAPINNAFRLLRTLQAGDWQFQAHVSVQQKALFDAGVLLIWHSQSHWAKLCLEQAPGVRPMLVSVVTRGLSDDANGEVLERPQAYVRISRLGQTFAFHASRSGEAGSWKLLRHFSLDIGISPVQIGVLVQSPTGEGCQATFSEVTLTPVRLAALRSGA
jgi:regulation of enolase protein 1 (concanavalin A-like superfamily)